MNTANLTQKKKRSLIMAGGGLKVAFQAGVLQVWLDEYGLEQKAQVVKQDWLH
jgi:predicted patatin/cPLA2 family phospholipase